MLCFILASAVHNQACKFHIGLFVTVLYTFFSFDYEPLVKIWMYTDYLCVFSCFLLSLFWFYRHCVYFCSLTRFLLIYIYVDSIRLSLSLQLPLSSLHFLCLVICFLVVLALFSCSVRYLFHLIPPPLS